MLKENGKLWATLHEGKYEVRSLSEADLDGALIVLDDAYFRNESISHACQVNLPENEQAREELRELCRITARDGVSLIVKHVESGQVVAVSFNKIQVAPVAGEVDFFTKFRDEQTHCKEAWSYMDYMITMDAKVNVFEVYNMDCVCELMFLGTLPDFGRLGLARALADSTIQLSRELGRGQLFEDLGHGTRDKRPQAVTALWTSRFSQKIGAAVGFEVLTRVPYSEFEFNGKSFRERIAPIHEFSEQVVFRL